MQNIKSEETNERLIAALKADKEEMETALTMEQLQSLQLKQQLAEAETRNTDLTKASFLVFQISQRGSVFQNVFGSLEFLES